jgi:hypothetical protein
MEGEVGDYQGASRIVRGTLDWKVCMRAILEGLAEPHSSMPFVQVGFRIVLYIVSLLVGSTVYDLCNSLRRSPERLYKSDVSVEYEGFRSTFNVNNCRTVLMYSTE